MTLTPAEHYAEAERLAALAVTNELRPDVSHSSIRGTVALGQLHATLATVPEGRAVLSAAGEPDVEAVLAPTLRELRAVLEEFHGVFAEGGRQMRAQMPQAAHVERMNRLAALERGDLIAYRAAQK